MLELCKPLLVLVCSIYIFIFFLTFLWVTVISQQHKPPNDRLYDFRHYDKEFVTAAVSGLNCCTDMDPHPSWDLHNNMYREKLGMRGESSLLKKKMHLFSYSRFFTLSHKYFTCSRNAQWINSEPHENVADLKQYCLRQCLKFPRNTALLWSAVMGNTSKTFPPALLVYNETLSQTWKILFCVFLA